MNKHIGNVITVFLIVSLLQVACRNVQNNVPVSEYFVLNGQTMGTYYRVVAETTDTTGLKTSIDQLLLEINSEVSTYEPDSYISQINKAPKGEVFTQLPNHFGQNLKSAYSWYELSHGYMDVSIGPLVNYWGFGKRKKAVDAIDSSFVSRLQDFVGLDKWSYDKVEGMLTKNLSEQNLDFSALAKGYAVDAIGEMLSQRRIDNYLIDIGGEGRAKGLNPTKREWVIGISVPKTDAELGDYQVLVQLKDKALATSGNYRNYYLSNGGIYGHTIDPKTGYPFQDELLSTTIVCESGMDADAIATACMAMGYAKATTFISSLSNVSACFLVGSEDGSIKTKFENGFVQYVVQE